MTSRTTQPQAQQQDGDAVARLGGWLFQRRTWLPIPLALAILLIPSAGASASALWGGLAIVLAGEGLRLWGVGHIGAISRTRSDRLGPLVSTGPFGLVRNPLYLGNMTLWAGLAVSAGLVWLVAPIVFLLGCEYHAIVRWEEQLLEARVGTAYRQYAAEVPRWIPHIRPRVRPPGTASSAFSWRDTLFSERGTLIAIAVGYALLYVKRHLTVEF
jgi:protein-S-isoprenylcysteine O-methyltransferase Ste14